MNWKKTNRKVHYWGALACAIPIIIVICTGVLLLLKKESEWIQPSTVNGQSRAPSVGFDKILESLKNNRDINVQSWSDIKRIDVRPSKGIMKVQLKNNWEAQLDQQTAKILKVSFRRSDIIESIHDGSYFHDAAKLWLFLPAAIVLLVLWITGIYLFAITEISKYRSKRKQEKRGLTANRNLVS